MFSGHQEGIPENPTHLETGREECSGEKVGISHTDAETELGDVHKKKVCGLDFRADVVLPIEGGHCDGRFGIQKWYVVTQSSIHVPLLGKEERVDTVYNPGLVFSVLTELRAENFQSHKQATTVGRQRRWNPSFTKSSLSIYLWGSLYSGP